MERTDSSITLFLCGDVMTGRGIDQILPHPVDPKIYEPYLKDARDYVEIAERENGSIPKPVHGSYIWGDALSELERVAPDLRMINLETSVTRSDDYWKGKEIHYRMHPANIHSISAAKIDCCALANNHVLDWGYSGLEETLETLKAVNVCTAGAGRNKEEAERPAMLDAKGKGRVIFFSFGSTSSGIPRDWAASESSAGINLLHSLSLRTIRDITRKVEGVRRNGDIVIVSIHWGGNWGYEISREQIEFARGLVHQAGVDVVHGHSSHHVKGLEIYEGKLILYGSGDFLNDYEGIGGYESYRGDLGLMYFAGMDPLTGQLLRLDMIPTQIKKFRLNRAPRVDAEWLRDVLNREGRRFGNHVQLKEENTLSLEWN